MADSTSTSPTSSSSPSNDVNRRLTILQQSPLRLQNTAAAPQTKNTKPMTFHLGEEVIGGFAAGVVGTLLGFPLDLVKTRMQTQASSTSSSAKQRGPMSLLSHILRTEGLSSMYKGVGPPLLSLSIVNTLSFTSYSYFRQNLFHGQDGWDYNNALSGMLGAPLFGLVTTPENFLKTQMQLDNVQVEREKAKQIQQQQSILKQKLSVEYNIQKQSRQQPKPEGRFTSSFQCARTLVSSHGASILYTGHVVNTIREAAFVGAYFFCYEGYKCEFQKLLLEGDRLLSSMGHNYSSTSDSSWASSLAIPIAGGFSGATSWFLTFPMDCVRAGVQGQLIPTASSTPIQKQGALETFKQLIQNKGLTGLYAGVAPSIARAFLVSGSRFSAYEGALYLCRIGGFTTEHSQYKDGAANYDN
ncbi:hypothetical protein ACHAXM_002661 [Skeletonema potamos]|jgi:solute carrier family 25 carnitine/acylcarnitine transporter 20/29